VNGFYILDVPEFAPLLVAAKRIPACQIHASQGGYVLVTFDHEIEILRAEAQLGEAVWFGCLTGGLTGKIMKFDAVSIRLAPVLEAAMPR
jgi:hypothetical protein